MDYVTKVPVSLLEELFNLEDFIVEIFRYHAYAVGWQGVILDEEFFPTKSVTVEDETILVSSYSFVMVKKALIEELDFMIYVYINYLITKSGNEDVKIDVGEISRKFRVKKTRVRISLNALLSEKLLCSQQKSGYYSLAELKYPEQSPDQWDIIYKDLRPY